MVPEMDRTDKLNLNVGYPKMVPMVFLMLSICKDVHDMLSAVHHFFQPLVWKQEEARNIYG